jgi:signal transduction histidine kinase
MLEKGVLNVSKLRRATQVAFVVIIVFVLSQVVWWIVFQHNYIARVTDMTLNAWQRDAAFVTNLAAEDQQEALEQFPYLRFENGQVSVDPDAAQAFRNQQQGYLRMFAFEGPFFVLVVLSGLFIIHRNLQAERELKARQQNFLNAISHEFKTPLSSLKLLLETALYRALDPTFDPEKTRKYLTRMQGELAMLETTSEQVLAAARLERPDIAKSLAPMDFGKTVATIVNRLKPGLEARGAQVVLEPYSQPLPVPLDEAALSLVISNLLDNAVKYSPSEVKPITVRVRAEKHHAVLEVDDAGIGITESECGRIFDKFYRVGNEMTRQSKGIGLGLYLVQTTVEAMNGWVRCMPLDKGSRFAVMLPKHISQHATLTASHGDAPQNDAPQSDAPQSDVIQHA